MRIYRVRVDEMCRNCEEYGAVTFRWFESEREAEVFVQSVRESKWDSPRTEGTELVEIPVSQEALVAWLNSYIMGPDE